MSFIFAPVCALLYECGGTAFQSVKWITIFTSSKFYSVKRKHKEFLKWIKKGIKKK